MLVFLNQLIDRAMGLQTFHLKTQTGTSESTLWIFLILYIKYTEPELIFTLQKEKKNSTYFVLVMTPSSVLNSVFLFFWVQTMDRWTAKSSPLTSRNCNRIWALTSVSWATFSTNDNNETSMRNSSQHPNEYMTSQMWSVPVPPALCFSWDSMVSSHLPNTWASLFSSQPCVKLSISLRSKHALNLTTVAFTFGSWTNEFPLVPGGKSPVDTYLRHSMIV